MTSFSVKMFRALVVPRMKLFENGAWFWLAHVDLYCTLNGSLLHGLYVFSRHFLPRSRKQQLNILHPQHLNFLCVLNKVLSSRRQWDIYMFFFHTLMWGAVTLNKSRELLWVLFGSRNYIRFPVDIFSDVLCEQKSRKKANARRGTQGKLKQNDKKKNQKRRR